MYRSWVHHRSRGRCDSSAARWRRLLKGSAPAGVITYGIHTHAGQLVWTGGPNCNLHLRGQPRHVELRAPPAPLTRVVAMAPAASYSCVRVECIAFDEPGARGGGIGPAPITGSLKESTAVHVRDAQLGSLCTRAS